MQDMLRYMKCKKTVIVFHFEYPYVDYFLHFKWLSSRGGDQLKKIRRLKGMWGILPSEVA